MEVDKNALRAEFTSEWEKHYKVNAIIERGFIRQKCSTCSKMFWAKEKRSQCGDSACIGYQFIGNTPVKKKLDYIDTWKCIEKYFINNGHGYVKPYPTVARWRDDLYFTIASINDFQPYVVNGELEPPSNPLIVPQPCVRFPDIANVGVSGRHYTNFVMIGQHAFNTKKTGLFYWKEEALNHDLNYLKALGIPEEEIIFQEDVWAGGGNFGPCIEYFVRGLELGNCVFMQYEVTQNGRKELPTKVIDMGAGLARLAWITSGEPTSYEVVFGPVIASMKKNAGISVDKILFEKYAKISGSLNEDEVGDLEIEKEKIAAILGISKKELFETIEPLQALYATADHLKTILFTSTDGLLPGNSGGGYNLRILLRRVFGFAERFGYDLDYAKIIEDHADHVEYLFPYLKNGVQTTIDVIEEEEKRYKATKEKARSIIINIVKKAKSTKTNISNKERDGYGKISKDELVKLYKSDGIPPESLIEIAKENGVAIEFPGNFYNLVREGEGKSASDRQQSVKVLYSDVATIPKTEPLFYSDISEFTSKVISIIKEKYIVLETTAFYPEGGGQVADTGSINGFKVLSVIKQAGVILHEVNGRFAIGDEVHCVVDLARRKTIARHHTGAHILNAAARAVLGPHVWQGGSNKDEEKAHLDITHYKKITTDQLQEIEIKANEYIMRDYPIKTEILPRNVAEKKYGFMLYQGGAVPGKELRVVSIGDIDSEACGGTHHMLKTTGEIGLFKIVKRESVHDGVERIVFKCGIPALKYIHEKERLLKDAAGALSVPESELTKSTERFFSEWKEQKKRIDSLTDSLVNEEAAAIEKTFSKPIFKITDLNNDALKKLAIKVTTLKAAGCFVNKEGSIICASGIDSISANDLLQKVITKLGGTGGGKDNLAQGKIKKIENIEL